MTISFGSVIFPSPYSPHAISPISGPIILYPKLFNFNMFSLVEGCSHILTFIAGAKNICLLEANKTVDAKSSAFPEATFDMVLAVIGATNTASAHLDKDIWSISASFSALNISS